MIDRSESHLIAQERRNRGGTPKESTTKVGRGAGNRTDRRKPGAAQVVRIEPSIGDAKRAVPGAPRAVPGARLK